MLTVILCYHFNQSQPSEVLTAQNIGKKLAKTIEAKKCLFAVPLPCIFWLGK